MPNTSTASLMTPIPASKCTAHRPPALLVESLLDVDDETIRVQVATDLLSSLDFYGVVECCAQAIAVGRGGQLLQAGFQSGAGYLVGVDGFSCDIEHLKQRPPFYVCAEKTRQVGAIESWHCRLMAADQTLVAEGEIRVTGAL